LRPQSRYRLILTLFFVSGAFGLGYQILWSKFLLDFIGVSAYSYATVLAAFMGGLALGSAWLGRVADRVRSPLRLYAILELGVGIYAVLYLPLTRAVSSLYGQWVRFSPDEAGASMYLWAKVVSSGLLLLPPTILLGGTFPAMVRHVSHKLGVVGRRASQLYALNAFGAVVGTLAMAFFVLPGYGMHASLLLLGAGNVLVAAAAWGLSSGSISPRAVPDDAAPTPAPPPAPPPAGAAPATVAPAATTEHPAPAAPVLSPALVRLALLIIALEGAVSFCYEIAWTRYFGLVLGSSTYSFAIMLAAFITGIALGGAIFAKIEHRLGHPIRLLGWTQLAVGIVVAVGLPFYPHVPWLFVQYRDLFSTQPQAFFGFELGKLVFCYLFMLPPTVLIGMAIPILVKGLASDLRLLGRDAGRIYAWNTWGSVLGSLAAGLLLLPLLGMEGLLRASAFANVLLGFAVIAIFRPASAAAARFPLPLIPASGLVLLVLLQITTSGWNHSWFSLVRFRRDVEPRTFQQTKEQLDNFDVIVFEDDPAANLMVTKNYTPEGYRYTLYVNGKADASSGTDLPTQYLSGHLPALLHPEPKDVLIIGLASGITAGASLKYPIDRLDVVELIRAMPRATRHFRTWNDSPLADPRCQMIYDDARSYLQYTTQSYDIIISEPSNPWMAGTGALFTADFFGRAKEALREDGIYLQWIQLYDIGDEALAAVLRSFRTAFPHVYGFQGNNVDLLLLGSRAPIEPDWSRLERRMADPGVRRQLEVVNVRDVPSLLLLQRFSPLTADYIASTTDQLNTDDNHYLEYRAPRDLFRGVIPAWPFTLDERPEGAPGLLWSRYLRDRDAPVDTLNLVRLLQDYRIRIETVSEPFKRAVWELRELSFEELEGDLRDIFRDPFALRSATDAASFAARVERLADTGSTEDFRRAIAAYRSPLLVLSALSTERAAGDLERIRGWADGTPSDEKRAILGALEIDVALAAGRTEEAARLLEENAQAARLPTEWLLVRACRTGDRAVLHRILAAAPTEDLPLAERLAGW